MPIDCNNPPCSRVLPASTFISVFGDATVTSTDCSTNLLFLTDEAGLVNQADPASGDYLTTDSRLSQVCSIDEIDLHFSRCSRTHYELSAFFGWKRGELMRPKTITIAYFDSANESMLEAVEAIHACFPCFYTVTHVAYDKDGTPIYDTAPQLELAEWGTAYGTRVVLPTISELLIDADETTSNAAISKQEEHTEAIYQFIEEECIPEIDADCVETGGVSNTYGVQHLVMAGVVASISSESSDYKFNVKFKPIGANELAGVSTSQLTQDELYVVTGSNPYLGGVQILSQHHVNVYHNISGKRFLLEGLTATGAHIDELVHKRYINDMLDADLMNLMTSNNVVSMADLGKLTSTITLTIRDFINKGLITDIPGSIDLNDFDDVHLSGNGWVLTKADTTQAHLDSRITPTFIFCYVRPGAVNYISLGLCDNKGCS